MINAKGPWLDPHPGEGADIGSNVTRVVTSQMTEEFGNKLDS